MLRNVLADYLNRATERQLDLPLLFLLPAMEFHDVHLLHGQAEFGKDIIAKLHKDGNIRQYVFQSKIGNIPQSKFRNEILGQLLESLTVSLSHPSFDSSASRQVVLVTTGELKGNAALAFQDFNRDTVSRIPGSSPVEFWGGQDLLESFATRGVDTLHGTALSYKGSLGRFFAVYGNAVRGRLTPRQIEEYSRVWVESFDQTHPSLLRAALEAATLSQQCERHGRFYEASYLHLALLRVLFTKSYIQPEAIDAVFVDEAVIHLHAICDGYIKRLRKEWQNEKNLLGVGTVRLDITTYLVHCARTMELASLAYWTSDNVESQTLAAEFLEDFISNEPGCSHPISDRYSVTVVAAVLVLSRAGKLDSASKLVEQTASWLFDRFESGNGLASLEADEVTETNVLLGSAFSFMDFPPVSGSLLATALVDLAAFLGDHELYGDIVNDTLVCNINAEYWQVYDTVGACSIEGGDVIHYPSVQFSNELSVIDKHCYASHVKHEIGDFAFTAKFGAVSAIFISLFLRDRYFLRLWTRLANKNGQEQLSSGECEVADA